MKREKELKFYDRLQEKFGGKRLSEYCVSFEIDGFLMQYDGVLMMPKNQRLDISSIDAKLAMKKASMHIAHLKVNCGVVPKINVFYRQFTRRCRR